MGKISTRKGIFLRLTLAAALVLSSTVAPWAQMSLYTPYPEDGREIDASPQLGAGCDSNVYTALNNASNYTYNQAYSNTYGYLHQPTTFYGCLQTLFNEASSLLNMFNGTGGFNIGAILSQLAQTAVTELLTQLENKVCQIVSSYLPSLGNAAYAVSGLTQGTSVTNLLGAAPYVTDLTQSSQYAGDAGMALNTMGASISGPTTPYVAEGAPNQYGGTSNNIQLVAPTGLNNETTDESNPVSNPSSSATVVNPVGGANSPSVQAIIANQQLPPGGTSTYGGTESKTYQRALNVVTPEYIGPTEQCASLTETLTGIASTPNWHVGQQVQGTTNLAPGTAIATFFGPGGTYITPGSENQHTGLYLGQSQSCMSIFEQWKGSKPHVRCMLWQGLGGAASRPINRGVSYYVIQG